MPPKFLRRLLPALLSVALPAGAALAQAPNDETTTLADELIDCAGLPGDGERLECYDALAQPLLGLDGDAEAPTDQAIYGFTGKGDWDSEVLEVERPWRVTWQNQGSLLTIELWDSAGELLNVVGNQIGRGGGRSEVLDPGSYRLAVRGTGGWRVQAVPAQ
jgi:hypothetical protein